jgi:hypothetical protein
MVLKLSKSTGRSKVDGWLCGVWPAAIPSILGDTIPYLETVGIFLSYRKVLFSAEAVPLCLRSTASLCLDGTGQAEAVDGPGQAAPPFVAKLSCSKLRDGG